MLDGPTRAVIPTIDVRVEPGDTWPTHIQVDAAANRIYVAYQGVPRGVAVIDGATNAVAVRWELRDNIDGPNGLALNEAAGRLYVAQGTTRLRDAVSVFDTRNGARLADIAIPDRPVGMVVDPTANRLYLVHSFRKLLSVIDGDRHELLTTLPLGGDPKAVAVDPGKSRVYVALLQGMASVDGATQGVLQQKDLPGFTPEALVVHPATGLLYAVHNWPPKEVRTIDPNTLQVVATQPLSLTTNASLALDPRRHRLYATSVQKNVVKVLELAGSAVGRTDTVILGSRPVDVAVNPSTRKLYVADAAADAVSVLDAPTRRRVATIELGEEPRRLAVNPVRNEVYVTTRAGLYILDGATDRVAAVVELAFSAVGRLAVDAGGERVYATGRPTEVQVIDARTRAVIARLGIKTVIEHPEGIAVNATTNKVYVAHLSGGLVEPVVSAIQPIPGGLRETITGWSQVGGPLGGGVTVFRGSADQAIAAFRLPAYHYGAPLAADEAGNRVYAALGAPMEGLVVIDGESDRIVESLRLSEALLGRVGSPVAIVVDPARSRLALSTRRDAVLVVDTRTLGIQAVVDLPERSSPAGVAVDPESSEIYAANSGTGTLSVIRGD